MEAVRTSETSVYPTSTRLQGAIFQKAVIFTTLDRIMIFVMQK
jgi:hypothetical protein